MRPAQGRLSAGLLFVALLGGAAAGAHSSSRGHSRFAVQPDGSVEVLLEVRSDDVLDLFDVDLSNEAEAGRLSPLLKSTLPRLLKIRGEGLSCPLTDIGWSRRGGRTVKIEAVARCEGGGPPAELTIDWGLSSHATLDLVSYAQVTAPGRIEHVAVFSRADPKGVFRTGRPSLSEVIGRRAPPGALFAFPGALLLLAALGLAAPRRGLAVAAAFALGGVTAALGQLLPEAVRSGSVGLVVLAGAGLAMAAAPVVLADRPGLARGLHHGLAMLGGLGSGLVALAVGDPGFDLPRDAALGRALGALSVFALAGLAVVLAGRLFARLDPDQRLHGAVSLAGLGAAAAVALLLFGPL